MFLHVHTYVLYLRLSCSACICMYNRVYKMNRCHIRRSPLRVSPNQGPYRPIRARLAQSGPVSPNQGPARRPMIGRLEEHLYHLNIREEVGGIVWVKPSSKCASCHSNEMLQRIIHTHVKVSSKAYVYDDTIYNFCARARFAGCSYLRLPTLPRSLPTLPR